MTRRASIAHAAMMIASLACVSAGVAQQESEAWPQRVLITNDDGIHEDRLWPLARAFAVEMETWVVASTEDRSGSSNVMSLGKNDRSLSVQRVLRTTNMTAYAVSGFPADCVVFGIRGLLKDKPPDLVVSGVNGGPNLGLDGWFGSGTIGAVRTAAFLGIPAIAVSGLDDDDSDMVAKVANWVVDLAKSRIVRGLEPGQYLTVAIPKIPANEIRGVRVAPRTPSVRRIELDRVLNEEDEDESVEVWVVRQTGQSTDIPPDSDGSLYHQGYIVITPMRLGEDAMDLMAGFKTDQDDLPSWHGGQ